MRDVTLCFLLRESEICLAMKKRGFGEGKINGVGGKVSPGEDILAAAVRELEEEIGVVAVPADLAKVAEFEFSFKDKPEWSQRMHVFFIHSWTGEPVESEEMKPSWYELTAVPYQSMWIDDELWLPRVLQGEKLTGAFHFSSDGSEILHYEITPASFA